MITLKHFQTKNHMYYTLEESTNKEIGREFPQIQESIETDLDKSVYKMPYHKFASFSPDLDHLILHKNSNYTDFLSCVYRKVGFIISERVKNILIQLDLPEHKLYNAKVYKDDNIFKKYWSFVFYENIEENIDFTSTPFFIKESFKEDIPIKIYSKNDLHNKINELSSLKTVYSTNVILKKHPSYDIFYLHKGNSKVYISKNFRNLLIEENITGIDIRESRIFTVK